MVENAIGTVGTFAELLKKFRLGKGLDSGTFNWYASLATRPIVPMAMLRWFWGINDKNKKTQSSDKSSIKKPAVAGCFRVGSGVTYGFQSQALAADSWRRLRHLISCESHGRHRIDYPPRCRWSPTNTYMTYQTTPQFS
jgi:hypothetical protein